MLVSISGTPCGDKIGTIKELTRQIEATLRPFCLDENYDYSYGFSLPKLNNYQTYDSLFNLPQKSFADLVVAHMSELDWPIHLDQGSDFCTLFGLNEADSQKIMDACATDEQWEEYEAWENRRDNY